MGQTRRTFLRAALAALGCLGLSWPIKAAPACSARCLRLRGWAATTATLPLRYFAAYHEPACPNHYGGPTIDSDDRTVLYFSPRPSVTWWVSKAEFDRERLRTHHVER